MGYEEARRCGRANGSILDETCGGKCNRSKGSHHSADEVSDSSGGIRLGGRVGGRLEPARVEAARDVARERERRRTRSSSLRVTPRARTHRE